MPYLDLTHTFTAQMPTFPGDQSPTLTHTTFLERDGNNSFHLSTGLHNGTHIDAPLHMLRNGKRLSAYPPGYFIRKAHLLDARNQPRIETSLLQDHTISAGEIILIYTGHYEKFGTPSYYESYPELTEEFAHALTQLRPSLIGLDTPSPDTTPFAIHKILLAHDILIIENLTNLAPLLTIPDFTLIALPMKLDAEAAPARVIAQIP